MTKTTNGLRAALLGAAVLAGAQAPAALAAPVQHVKLTILGVGDLYNFDAGKDRGGFARLNALAKAEKAKNPNFLYVFDGDMLSPSLLSGLDGGQNTIDLTNLVPFDIAVPGNHEFDAGPKNFFERVKASKYPWATVTITEPDGSQPPGLNRVMWKTIAGLKIALIPISEDDTPVVASPGDLKFLPSVPTGIAAAKAARKEGADLVIAVSQTPHNQDFELMASHAFDVIMSGDDHDYMTAYDGITAYVETSIDAKFMSPLDLNITVSEKDGKKVVKWTPDFRFVDTATVAPDPETQKMVDAFKTKLDQSLGVVIGTTDVPLDSRRNMVRSVETSMGNLIADAMRAATHADVALTNGGGIRGDKTYDAGAKLTRKDILTELPFGNKTVLTQIPGSQLLAALENGFSEVEHGAGRFPQVSGMKVVWDPTAPPMHRVQSVTVDGKPLGRDTLYKVATNDYMLAGGDGYTALGGGKVLINQTAGSLMANDVMAYVEKAGHVTEKVEGRITKAGQ
ncbi:MAG: 5'-nucleotidase C-terminal domain-containing protein [Paracoccaceae bacterium]|nr:5'-nucleotidase C-terminal domain-containing protein [Paracoccaceae bacterium]